MKYYPFNFSVNKPNKESIALFLWLSLSLILAVARFVLNKLGFAEGVVREIILIFISCIPFIFLLAKLNDKGKVIPRWVFTFFGILLIAVSVFFISLVANRGLAEFYFRKDYGIGPVFRPEGAIFAFLFFVVFDDPKELRSVMTKAAYVLFAFQVIVVFLPVLLRGYWIDIAPDGSELHLRYSLSFGYDMLLLLMIFFTEGLRKKKIGYYILSVICAVLIVTNGGRGAIAVLAVFVILLIILKILNRKTSPMKKFVMIAIIVIAIVAYLFFIDDLLAILVNVLKGLNINSRSIEMLLKGSFSASNGRDRIWNAVIDAIRSGGPFGYGMFGDRPFVAPLHIAGYSHNLILELLVSFGVFGVVIVAYIIKDAVKMLFVCKDDDWKEIYLILFVGSCKLLLSFSFWYIWEFWAAAAVAYKYGVVQKYSYACRKNDFKEIRLSDIKET